MDARGLASDLGMTLSRQGRSQLGQLGVGQRRDPLDRGERWRGKNPLGQFQNDRGTHQGGDQL